MTQISDIDWSTAEQGTDAWLQARAGKCTASMFATARDTYKSGKNKGEYKAAALNYAFKLAVERISGQALDTDEFTPWQAKRGNALEPDARASHSFSIGEDVIEAGFCYTTDGRFGCSVDGLIGNHGIAEYKCFLNPEKLRSILLDGDIGDVMDQVQGGLWITGRQFCDFALYCPALSCIDREITIQRIQRDDDYIETMEQDLLAFDELVESYRGRLIQTKEAA